MTNGFETADRQTISSVIERFLVETGSPSTAVDADLVDQLVDAIERAYETSVETVREPSGGGNSSHMEMIVFRQGRRTAKSISFRNISADATTGSQALLTALTGSHAIAGILSTGTAGLTFLPFIVGFAFTLWKSMEKTIGWAEACLLYALSEEANFTDFVSYDVAYAMGPVLKERFGYAKGTNSNEVEDLLDKLVAHGALQRDARGFRLLEGVKKSSLEWDA